MTFFGTVCGARFVWGDTRPNIVLIISDDHDYEHFGFMGHPAAHTPTLDRLAEAGTVFRTAHLPAARCTPTLASFLSGRWPHQTGIYYNYGPDTLDPEDSLPNLLREAGYATLRDGKTGTWSRTQRREGIRPEAMGFTHAHDRNNNFVRTSQERLFKYLDDVAGKQPFFVWWMPRIPHTPHNPPARFRNLFPREEIVVPDWFDGEGDAFRRRQHLSHAMEAWLDEGVAQLVDKLEHLGQLEQTLFVFVVDNGWANGLVSKGSPFEKGVRTPIFFSWPGQMPGGQYFDDLVSTLDLYPTILDFANVPIPPNAAGKSLRARIEGGPSACREVLYGAAYPAFASEGDERPERDAYALYLRTARWKYVLYLQDVLPNHNNSYFRIQHILTDFPTRKRGDQDLYDLSADPYELNNLAALSEHHQRLQQFKQQALQWWMETGGQPLEP